VVILGAGGFLGRALLSAAAARQPVKAVARTILAPREGVTWFAADLSQPASLDAILSPGDVVINAAHASSASDATNRQLLDNVIQACERRRVARLLHCSTAVVAGATRETRVTESTTCVPVTPYERTKLALEHQVADAGKRGLDVAILRPTAIVGPGGANLLKLSRALRGGNAVANYLRACLFGTRPMHLVPVRNVAAGLVHVAGFATALRGEIYHVAADEDPDNNFATVERLLLSSLGLPARRLAPMPVSPRILGALLRMLGRSDTGVARVYDSQKLRDTGFTPPDSVATAIGELGAALRGEQLQ
jgi:nucleoside-diphosphate-sugar epimerase